MEEKIWTILGPEFGADQGKKATIVRAIYGLKSSGASFRNHLADCMRPMGYTPCLADPDLWMKAEVREDGFKYYAYVLCYVDDVFSISHNAEEVLNRYGVNCPYLNGSSISFKNWQRSKTRLTSTKMEYLSWNGK